MVRVFDLEPAIVLNVVHPAGLPSVNGCHERPHANARVVVTGNHDEPVLPAYFAGPGVFKYLDDLGRPARGVVACELALVEHVTFLDGDVVDLRRVVIAADKGVDIRICSARTHFEGGREHAGVQILAFVRWCNLLGISRRRQGGRRIVAACRATYDRSDT
jgi:hypothetical protein